MSLHALIERRNASNAGADRREVLRLMALGSAAAMASCGRPSETIVPYVDELADVASGERLKYATALELSGYARGAVGVVIEGRPIKVEGSPNHPASLGSTDVFMESAVLELFDPQRSKSPVKANAPADWSALGEELRARLAAHRADSGAGLALLTGRVLSPTILGQIQALKTRLPAMRHARWEPIDDDAERQGTRLAYGRPLLLSPRLEEADVIVCLDADPLGPGPDQIRFARAFAARRRPEAGPMSRLYVVEPALSTTGALADRHAALRPELIANCALGLAAALGSSAPAGELPEPAARLVALAARDLKASPGRAVVLAGRAQPPQVHALAAWLNDRLRAPIDRFEPLDPVPEDHQQSLAGLAAALEAGQVSTLVILDGDPVYAAPPGLGFEAALKRAPFSLHAGLYRGMTGRRTRWHAPLSHPFESWSDARAFDGTASLVQPLIRPLYDTRTAHALLAMMAGPEDTPDLARVQQAWQGHAGGGFDDWWRAALAAGVIPNSRAAAVTAAAAGPPQIAPVALGGPPVLVLRPSAQVWDGRFAANAWLQECPEPLTKEVWGASLCMSPADAGRLGLSDGDPVVLTSPSGQVEAAAKVLPAQGEGVFTLPVGYGRRELGPVADGVGADAVRLRGARQDWVLQGLRVARGGAAVAPPVTQHGMTLEGKLAELYPVVPGAPPTPRSDKLEDLLPQPRRGPRAWAMLIDNAVCIGCNACVLACQAENNIPVIGPDQIRANRDMHWLRIDRYDLEGGITGFEPVPCMQCEEAPCEPVCPVAASVHDSEGLNDQVYNRCIGTRFCESNCPYKVRRFNFFDYSREKLFGRYDTASIEAQRNPDVSVRGRGVMEKCTYCVQRISAARREAEKQDREIRPGEVTTACQDACPTRAIRFGNLSDPSDGIGRAKSGPRHFALLDELKTRPRTTYLARTRNPPPGEDTA